MWAGLRVGKDKRRRWAKGKGWGWGQSQGEVGAKEERKFQEMG
jgi:hypothetical protein